MCFRPSEVNDGPTKCPECGKAIQSLGGIVPKNCPFCKAEFKIGADISNVSEGSVPPSAPKVPGPQKNPDGNK